MVFLGFSYGFYMPLHGEIIELNSVVWLRTIVPWKISFCQRVVFQRATFDYRHEYPVLSILPLCRKYNPSTLHIGCDMPGCHSHQPSMLLRLKYTRFLGDSAQQLSSHQLWPIDLDVGFLGYFHANCIESTAWRLSVHLLSCQEPAKEVVQRKICVSWLHDMSTWACITVREIKTLHMYIL